MRHGSQYRVGVLVAFPVFPSRPITVSWPTVCPPPKKNSQSSSSNAYTRAVSIWAPVQQSCSLRHHRTNRCRAPHLRQKAGPRSLPFRRYPRHNAENRSHATGPRMPPEWLMFIAVRSLARHLIPLRNNQTYHKRRCGSDKDTFNTLFHFVYYCLHSVYSYKKGRGKQ